MTEWRPQDWSNPYGAPKETMVAGCYEHGATDLLEALRKQPYCTNPVLLPNGKYYLIPDDPPDPQPEKEVSCQHYWVGVGNLNGESWIECEKCGKEQGKPQPEKTIKETMTRLKVSLKTRMYEGLWQPHPATKVIESGYFCPVCGGRSPMYCGCNHYATNEDGSFRLNKHKGISYTPFKQQQDILPTTRPEVSFEDYIKTRPEYGVTGY
jgi:hypothetical protein